MTVNAPTNLAAGAVSQTSVALSLMDNNTNETATLIQRATAPSGPWTTITTLAATSTTGTLNYTDNTVAANTTYYYQAYAVNGAVQSAINGPISVTTPAVVVTTGASISGMVFNDSNGNGVQDAGELAITGAQVYLDINGVGSYISTDPITTTDSSGNYTFANLQPSNYLVRIVPVAGKVINAPLWGGKFWVPLAANQKVVGDNFAVQSISSINVKLANGQIMAASINSASQLTLSRYIADTAIDVTFGNLGAVTIPSVVGTPTAMTTSGSGVLVAYANDSVAFGNDGSLDSSRVLSSPINLVGTAVTLTSNALTFVDNNTNTHIVQIDRSTDGGINWSPLASLSNVVVGNTITYTDNTVVAGGRYTYRVTAINKAVRSNSAGPVSIQAVSTVPAAGAAWVPYAQLIGQDVVANQYPQLNGSGVGVVVIDRGLSYN